MRMKWYLKAAFLVLLGLVSQLSSAQPLDANKALEKLKKARPDFQFGPILESEVPGLVKTSVADGPTIYLTPDGGHFFAGGLYEVGEDRIVDLAEREMEQSRSLELSQLSLDEAIIFKSRKSNKAVVYVFTDVDCYYCQKLHLEIDEINDLGIEIRYLAYPRKGLNSPGYQKIVSAWCADDPNEALTQLKSGRNIKENMCKPNPVAEHFALGSRIGVRGTPALVTEDGRMLPGYMPADELAKRIGI